MKQKYRKANFDERREKKIIEIANEINFFRDQCHHYKHENKKIKAKINHIKDANNGLIAENAAMKSSLRQQSNYSLRYTSQ